MTTFVKGIYDFREYSKGNLHHYYDQENVVALYIVKSGWSRPQTYHCILEWGEYEEVVHNLYSAQEIENIFGIKSFSRKDKLKAINESTL